MSVWKIIYISLITSIIAFCCLHLLLPFLSNKIYRREKVQFADVLNELTPDLQEQNNLKTIDNTIISENGINDNKMTSAEMYALRQQLAGCWQIPDKSLLPEAGYVELQLHVAANRTIVSAEVVNKVRYDSDSRFRILADSAHLAVLDPKCSPLLLPPNKYEQWKNTVVRFDPIQSE